MKTYSIDEYMPVNDRAELVKSVLGKHGMENGFVAYTDGSCWNSDPNRSGGAAYVVLDNHGRVYRSAHKGFRGTSNNRMEMLAIISAVASVPKGCSIVVLTDSQYSIRAFTYGGSKNQDLIELFDKWNGSVGMTGIRSTSGATTGQTTSTKQCLSRQKL